MLTKQLQFAVGMQSPGAHSPRAGRRLPSCSRALHPRGDWGNAGCRLDMVRDSPRPRHPVSTPGCPLATGEWSSNKTKGHGFK